MKSMFAALMILAAPAAFAVDFDCNNGQLDNDSFTGVSYQNGVFTVQFWETHYEIPATDIANQISENLSKSGEPETQITLAKDAVVTVTAEGDVQQATVTAIFIYSPESRAGRLTFISDGYSVARNRLLDVCN